MAEPVDAALEQLKDIPAFLTHETAEVRAQALEILKGFSVEVPHVKYLQSLGIIKTVLRMVSDESTVSTGALTLLANLSASEDCRTEMIEGGVVSVCMDFLLSAVNVRASRLALMVLNNITLDSAGAIDAMQEGKAYEGLHAIRLFKWFNDKTLARAQGDDWALSGHILSNLSQRESFRRLLVDPKRQLLLYICDHIRGDCLDRRLSALRMVHNLVYDVDKQFAVLDPAARVWPVVLMPILAYNADGAIAERDLELMLPDVQVFLATPTKQYDASSLARRLVMDIINVLCRNPPARALLRATNTYHLLREVHKLERELEDDEVDAFLDDVLVPYFILDEDVKEDEPAKLKTLALYRLERQSQGLSYEEEEEEETADDNAPMARLVPDEDGDIIDAGVYNDKMLAMKIAEEKAMEERAKALGKTMYSPKEDAFDALKML